jgi:hypothetical protein
VQPLKNFPAFYGSRRFNTVKSPPLVPILSHINPIHSIPSYLSFSLTSKSSAFLEKPPIVQLLREFPNILWNLKVHCGAHKCPPVFCLLSQIDPDRTTSSYFGNIRLDIIHPLTSLSSKWSICLWYSVKSALLIYCKGIKF